MKRKILTMVSIAVMLFGCSEESATQITTNGIVETTPNQPATSIETPTENTDAKLAW